MNDQRTPDGKTAVPRQLNLKRLLYVGCFIVLGLLLQFLLRAGVETAGISIFGWTHWDRVHGALVVGFFALGAWWGYASGMKWWNVIYVEKRFGWPPTWMKRRGGKARWVVLFLALAVLFGLEIRQIFWRPPVAPLRPVETPVVTPAPPVPPAPSTPTPTTPDIKLGDSFTLRVGQGAVIQGGLRVRLLSIGDSRCPKGVQCIWAGELSPRLQVSALDGGPVQELTLGTSTKRSAEVLGRVVTLKEAGPDQATLVVTQR